MASFLEFQAENLRVFLQSDQLNDTQRQEVCATINQILRLKEDKALTSGDIHNSKLFIGKLTNGFNKEYYEHRDDISFFLKIFKGDSSLPYDNPLKYYSPEPYEYDRWRSQEENTNPNLRYRHLKTAVNSYVRKLIDFLSSGAAYGDMKSLEDESIPVPENDNHSFEIDISKSCGIGPNISEHLCDTVVRALNELGINTTLRYDAQDARSGENTRLVLQVPNRPEMIKTLEQEQGKIPEKFNIPRSEVTATHLLHAFDIGAATVRASLNR